MNSTDVMELPLRDISESIALGKIVPYLGPDCFLLEPSVCGFPFTQESLATQMTNKVSVPQKIRRNLTAASQFIENFKHRKTVVKLMNEAFSPGSTPNALHEFVVALEKKPLLIVDSWYDDTLARKFDGRAHWGQIQGVSQSEHFGTWVNYFDCHGDAVDANEAESWDTVIYKPLGSVSPASNYIVSDSDFVEVLTEIDIQTPIPPRVQELRVNSNFLFLGCRFDNQLSRSYARQIMKRSSETHWAVIDGALSRMEQRFLDEQHITRIDMPLATFLETLQPA